MVLVGVIGGSGLDDSDILINSHIEDVETKWGKPTSPLTFGEIDGVKIVLIARHGKNHQFSPTQVNYRANIQALKDAGVTHIIATTACGSLKEEIGRGDFIILDQFIDHTKKRENTFHTTFESGTIHPAMAHPFNGQLRATLNQTCSELNLKHHAKGTVITIEGPRFSTVAESKMFRIWGADVINMSVATEATLANELDIPYAAVAMSTDYDCWKEDEAPVTWNEILKIFNENSDKVKKLLIKTIPKIH